MTKDKNTYQVIIVGGGPAGISTALTLHARGIHCCIIETHKTPIAKSGEAIPPNAKPLLKQLGIFNLVENERHKIYYGNKSCWGTDQFEQKEFISERHGHGYLLDRHYFEIQLQEVLQHTNIKYYNGYKFKKAITIKNGVEAIIENETNTTTLKSTFIVDATGRKASVCRHLGVYKENLDTQFAITCTATLSNKIPHQIIVEATENGWWYIAPVHESQITLMFFTLKELLPAKNNLESYITSNLAKAKHVSSILKNVTIDFSTIKIMPAGTSCLQKSYGKNWVAVGDASYSYNPISSYGITSALASGFYGGHAIADTIDGKKEALEVYHYVVESAFQVYIQKLIAHYQLEQRWKKSYYWANYLDFL